MRRASWISLGVKVTRYAYMAQHMASSETPISHFLTSQSACWGQRLPVRQCAGNLTPPADGADLRAAIVASCLRGALPAVDFRTACFVRAMEQLWVVATMLQTAI